MDVQLASYIPLVLAAVMVVMVLAFTFIEKNIKAHMLARLYKDAPFFHAHQLLQQYHNAIKNPENTDELALVNREISDYFNDPHQLPQETSGQTQLTSTQYQQFAQAHRILQKQIQFINNEMSDKQRVMVSTQIKIDCLNYAESYCPPAEEGRESAAHSNMLSSIAKMP